MEDVKMKSYLASVTVVFFWCALTICSATNICSLEVDPGPCRGSFPMFYYNNETCRCERFIYGGCQGNQNRFPTLARCEAACGGSDCYHICNLPPLTTCRPTTTMWFFNPRSCQCEPFRYGCGGNANRFRSKEACEDVCGDHDCRCRQERPMGRCGIRRWFYNVTSNMCERYLSCRFDGNNFPSKRECDCTCRYECTLPRYPGPDGTSPVRRYFYNRRRDRCVRFRWGGEVSNANNFQLRGQCRRACMRRTTSIVPNLVLVNP